MLRNIIKLLGKRGCKYLFLAIIASVIIAIVELSISIIIQLLLSSFGILKADFKIFSYSLSSFSIYSVLILLLIIAAIRFVVQLTTVHVSAFLRDYTSYRLKKNALNLILFERMIERSSSSINFKISEIFSKSSEFIFNGTLFSLMLVQSVFLFCILFIIAWKEAILATMGICIIGSIVLFINKSVSKIAKNIPIEQKKLNESIEKIIRNFIYIKLVKRREQEYNSVLEYLNKYFSHSVKANLFSNVASQTGPFLGVFLIVVIILLSQVLWNTPGIVLISFIYLFVRFVQSLSILANYFGIIVIYYPQFALALKSINNESFSNILNEHSENVSILGRHNAIAKAQENKFSIQRERGLLLSPEIELNNVHFSYENSSHIFKYSNLKIKSGEQIGIIGESGSGKSTLLMLITGLLEPTSGKILIAGQPASAYIFAQDTQVGYVGPEPFLMKGTLKENLCYGINFNVTETEIFKILELVSLDELVAEKTLNYEIEENLSGLSAGQKQRICLARAILSKPSLLILDEATSNLDEKNELIIANIVKNLKEKCTTIIVSHRAGILKYADSIVELK